MLIGVRSGAIPDWEGGLTREVRHHLRHYALQTIDFPPTLTALEIRLADRDRENEHLDPGSFSENAADADDLSLAMRRLY